MALLAAVLLMTQLTVEETTPSDGLRLLPTPLPQSRGQVASSGGSDVDIDVQPPALPAPQRGPATPWGWAAAVIASGWTMWRQRRSRGTPRATPPAGMLVVFVTGFGSGPEAFLPLIRMMGLRPHQVHHFDWRRARAVSDPRRAAREARIDDAADALGGFIDGLASHGSPIFLIGHSKGGAAIAELLHRWDDHPGSSEQAVVGAMLLDPPLDDGPWGWLQSAGRHFPLIPNDGGYDPVHCTFLRFGCEDHRALLGQMSGVEVVVIRNRDAWLTNFDDRPPGLRIYELDDGGPSARLLAITDPAAAAHRVLEAHMGVLTHEAVAMCAVAEMWHAEGCVWSDNGSSTEE